MKTAAARARPTAHVLCPFASSVATPRPLTVATRDPSVGGAVIRVRSRNRSAKDANRRTGATARWRTSYGVTTPRTHGSLTEASGAVGARYGTTGASTGRTGCRDAGRAGRTNRDLSLGFGIAFRTFDGYTEIRSRPKTGNNTPRSRRINGSPNGLYGDAAGRGATPTPSGATGKGIVTTFTGLYRPTRRMFYGSSAR